MRGKWAGIRNRFYKFPTRTHIEECHSPYAKRRGNVWQQDNGSYNGHVCENLAHKK
jgi:hypothetical protein